MKTLLHKFNTFALELKKIGQLCHSLKYAKDWMHLTTFQLFSPFAPYRSCLYYKGINFSNDIEPFLSKFCWKGI